MELEAPIYHGWPQVGDRVTAQGGRSVAIHLDGIGKAFGVLMDMDKMLGADIEKGLVQLKTVTEGKQIAMVAAATALGIGSTQTAD